MNTTKIHYGNLELLLEQLFKIYPESLNLNDFFKNLTDVKPIALVAYDVLFGLDLLDKDSNLNSIKLNEKGYELVKKENWKVLLESGKF